MLFNICLRTAMMFIMKAVLFFTFLCSTITTISALCEGCIEGTCYTKSLIFSGFQVSGELAIDRTDNILYFHFEKPNKDDFTAGFNLNEIQLGMIPDLKFTFAHAVDQNTHNLYVSGPKGIRKYNPSTNRTTIVGLSDKIIWHLQYKDKLYYAPFASPGLFTFDYKQIKSISALSNYTIDDFIIDKKDDIYFMSDFTVYRLKKNAKSPEIFVDDIYSLTTDKDGNAYFIQPSTRGIYNVDYETDKFTEIGAFDSGNPFRVVFDSNNNIIYHDISVDKLYHLTPNYSHCRVSTRGKGKTRKLAVVANAL